MRPLSRFPAGRRRALAGVTALATCWLGLAVPALSSAQSPTDAATAPRTDDWTPKEPRLPTPWTDDVSPTNALPDYPRPQLVRQRWKNLNGVWQWQAAEPGESAPTGRTLDDSVLVPYPVESDLSGIGRHEDNMWYRRTFTVPSSWSGGPNKAVMLNFGAVDYQTEVYVNGTRVTTHTGGYDGFAVDIAPYLHATGPQEIVVGVEDKVDATWQPVGKQRRVGDRGIFYEGASGIWQTVWLEPVDSRHIDSLGLTTDIDKGTIDVTPDLTGRADGLTLTTRVIDDGTVVAKGQAPAGSTTTIQVPDPHLWSPDDPHLYDLRVTLKRGGQVLDEARSYVGMREIGVAKGADGRMRLTLNHEPTFLLSTLDQGYWPDGIYTAPTDEALAFDLRAHKRLGFNTVRKHIKVEPDRWYYWADRLGLMVWQDMPSMKTGGTPPQDARDEFERQLHEMVREHRSWTSIIGWVPFNEGWGEWDKADTGRIADDVKAQDPTRLVNAHSGVNCCNSHGDSGAGDIIDFHQYVGPATPSPDASRAAIDGEHGGFGLLVPGHMWFADGGAYEMEPDSATLTRRYVENQEDVLLSAERCGISGSIYTQVTDVEHEVNGFFTYDRAVEKMDFDQVRQINDTIVREGSDPDTTTTYPPGTPGLDGAHAWPADEASGSTVADTVGDDDLTLDDGVTWTTRDGSPALHFSGEGPSAQTAGPVVDTSGSFTVSAWVKLDSTTGWLTAMGQDGPVQSTFFLQKTGDSNKFAFSTAGGRAVSTFSPVADQWYHVVGVRDAESGVHSLYVDGELQDSFDQCLNPESTGPFTVGRAKFDGNKVDFWPGAVDQVKIWDRSLDAQEVAELYTQGG